VIYSDIPLFELREGREVAIIIKTKQLHKIRLMASLHSEENSVELRVIVKS